MVDNKLTAVEIVFFWDSRSASSILLFTVRKNVVTDSSDETNWLVQKMVSQKWNEILNLIQPLLEWMCGRYAVASKMFCYGII